MLNTYGFNSIGFLVCSSDMFALCALFLTLLAVITIIRLFLPRIPSLRNFERSYRENIIPIVLYVSYFKLSYCAVINFRFFDVTELMDASNAFAAMAFLILAIGFPLFHSVHAIIYWKELQDVRNFHVDERAKRDQLFLGKSGDPAADKFKPPEVSYFRRDVLFKEYDTSHALKFFYAAQFCMRRFLHALVLGYFYNNGWIQVALTSGLTGFALAWIGIVRPFKSMLRNALAFSNEVTLLTVHIFIFPFVNIDLPDTEYMNYPYLLLGAAAINFAIHVLAAIILGIVKLWQRCRKVPITHQDEQVEKFETEQPLVEEPIEQQQRKKLKLPDLDVQLPRPDLNKRKQQYESSGQESLEDISEGDIKEQNVEIPQSKLRD